MFIYCLHIYLSEYLSLLEKWGSFATRFSFDHISMRSRKILLLFMYYIVGCLRWRHVMDQNGGKFWSSILILDFNEISMRIYFVYVCLCICKSMSDQILTKKVLEDILIEKLHPLHLRLTRWHKQWAIFVTSLKKQIDDMNKSTS